MIRQWSLNLVAAVAAVAVAGSALSAQAPVRRGRLVVTVADQTGAVIPGAKVTVLLQDDSAPSAASAPALTDGVGAAVVEDLVEGRYAVQVTFEGFETAIVKDVRVRGPETRRRVTLQISRLDEAVTVSRDRRTSSLDPQGSAFSTVLTREQIDALPDDPDEMEAALKALAPPGAVFRVDGFTGGRLPPKSQIRSIRLPKMDMFAAQNHGGMQGMMHIDIMTMPGNGPLRGNVDFNFMDDALNARNPFTSREGEEQLKLGNYGLAGTIKQNRISFSLNGGAGTRYNSPTILAALPDGTLATDSIRQPRDTSNLSARLDYAINKDHAARFSFDRNTMEARNQGVGAYDLFGRAYRSTSSTNMLRASENGPLGRRMFTESRLQVRWTDSASESALEQPTSRVNDAFTSGGAQRRGGQSATEFEVATDLDYVRGVHSWRTGVLVEGGRYRSDDITNYLGTFTFASQADYQAGRPANFSRRIGDPNVSYSNVQLAAYVQDDYRIARSVLLSAGVRYGVQTHAGGASNLSPRATIAWSPRRDGALTLRAAYGYFYDWVAGDLYKQTLLVDGERLRDINISNPSYPDPGENWTTAPSNRYLWSDDLVLPSANRMTMGADRTLTKNTRLNASYMVGWGRGLLRGRNLNAPVNGVRPDPAAANVVELVSDAASRTHSVNVGYNWMRMDWKRTFFAANYTWGLSDTNTTGGFSLPANGNRLSTEWGPAASDVRHRVGASFNTAPFRDLSLGVNVRTLSGTPYNITTGGDDNGDGVFSDRPSGTSRNAARGAMQIDLGGRVSYAWGFGTRPQAGPGGGQVAIAMGGGGALAPAFGGGAESKRYRLEVYASGQNLLNRANFTSYSFVLTSPFYGQAVAAAQPRKVQVGVRFGF